MERSPLSLETPTPLVPPPGFAQRLFDLGVPLDEAKIGQLGNYLAHLLAMNQHMNLTAIDDPIEVWEKHALDSLALVPFLFTKATVVDVGSGGGVPGVPLAIARPDVAVTLIDSTQKKAAFLSQVARALRLRNVAVLAERAEKIGTRFDIVTARAVSRLITLVPIVAPLAKPGGTLLLVKGQKAAEELEEAAAVLAAAGLTHQKTVTTATGRIVVLIKAK